MAYTHSLTKKFLLAAKYEEIHALEQLQKSCYNLIKLGQFVHQLQKERAMSNIYLASNRVLFEQKLQQQIKHSDVLQQALFESLAQTYLSAKPGVGNSRLYNLITVSLQSLDTLPSLRKQITEQTLSASQSTHSFTQIITSLLNVFLEAADGSSDPVITHLLVAYFNFMQGKEYAGQERACGALAFASNKFDDEQKALLNHFQHNQQTCFDFFCEYADEPLNAHFKNFLQDESNHEIAKLRLMLQQLDQNNSQELSKLSEVWFDVATARIDIMHQIEQQVAKHLIAIAKEQISDAKQSLDVHQDTLAIISKNSTDFSTLTTATLLSAELDSKPISNVAAEKLATNKTLYDLIGEQSQHIKQINSALNEARKVINEQKTINQAKFILIEQLKLTEAQAHKKLQKQAMDNHASLHKVAKQIIMLVD
ncbi:MAG: nitrate- and nitrite sensing domain-containing protein [Pseudoalteromonas sp.]